MTRTQLLPEIFKLNADDQLLIAEAIRNHLAGTIAPPDEVEFNRELDRRLEDAEKNPADESPLADVLTRLRNKR
jgi:putative addiction module component (TIGR02574 family)